jgi:hypothetical protein
MYLNEVTIAAPQSKNWDRPTVRSIANRMNEATITHVQHHLSSCATEAYPRRAFKKNAWSSNMETETMPA